VTNLYDLLIRNGLIIDGSERTPYHGNIGTHEDKISKIGNTSESADFVIDATGMVVAPGFIDIHNHSDQAHFMDGSSENNLRQGVTTVIIGNCGNTFFPINDRNRRGFQKFLSDPTPNALCYDRPDLIFEDVASFSLAIQDSGIAVNQAPQIGYLALRTAVMGMDENEPNKIQLEEMKQILKTNLNQGAFGLTIGLEMYIQKNAATKELIELGKVIAEYDRVFAFHLRNYNKYLLNALEEAIKIADESRAKVHISHMQVNGYENRGIVKKAIHLIDSAVKDGKKISFDLHPWRGGIKSFYTLFPRWAVEDGSDEFIKKLKDSEISKKIKNEMEKNPHYGRAKDLYFSVTNNPKTCGKNLAEISSELGVDHIEALFSLAKEEGVNLMFVEFTIYEEDILNALKYPESVIGSDSTCLPKGRKNVHPRWVSTFPYLIERFVNKEKIYTLSQMIAKMTSKTAAIYGLKNRGILKPGYAADLVIFDPDNIKSNMSYVEPNNEPTGIYATIVNGKIAYKEGIVTGTRSGVALLALENQKIRFNEKMEV
jgi:N-acyl-D-amino-acid deacylase